MPKIDQPRCGRCEAGDWPYAANGGVERCDCLRGLALADADASRGRRRTDAPGITAEQAMIAIERLAVRMPMVPAGEFAHVELARDLIELVCDTEGLDWLVREATRRYPNWPGMREPRALYCAVFSPRDGVLVESAVYEGGFTQIAEPSPVRQLKQAKHGGQIGAEASAPLLARVMADISQPAAPPGRAGSDPHAAMAPPKPPPKVKPPLPTQEEIEAIQGTATTKSGTQESHRGQKPDRLRILLQSDRRYRRSSKRGDHPACQQAGTGCASISSVNATPSAPAASI